MNARHQTKCDAKDTGKKAYKNHIRFIEVLEDVLVVLLAGKGWYTLKTPALPPYSPSMPTPLQLTPSPNIHPTKNGGELKPSNEAPVVKFGPSKEALAIEF